jgi:hypothetical protein
LEGKVANSLTPEQTAQLAERLLVVIREKERLGKLTNFQLAAEALNSPASDYEVVLEMMDRICPGWEDDFPLDDDGFPPDLSHVDNLG